MAERKAVNKYYPPDWDPSKGSINTYVGQHPLRERAKKLGQGILVIRFEMPYNIWCGGCNSHIGMGVRYNAEKSKTGKYYTTPIYKFRMKCHLCDNYFEIQTDPKNHDYVILSGARRKEQRWDPKDNGQIVPDDKATQKKLATDAMYKLEHGSDDKQKGKSVKSSIAYIEQSREDWKDDYLLNRFLRGKFREEKKAIKTSESQDEDLLKKSSLDIALVKEEDEDRTMAGLIKYSVTESYDEKQKLKRKAISHRPIFESPSAKSRCLEITQKLGITSVSSTFDVPPQPSVSSKRLSLGIRKKSMDKCESSVSPSDNPLSNGSSPVGGTALPNCDTPTDGQTLGESTLAVSVDIPDCDTEASVGDSASGSDPPVCDHVDKTVPSGLGALINYSDSDGDP